MANGSSGRLRIVQVGMRMILDFFNPRLLSGGDAVAVRFSKDAQLPDGCEVGSINGNWGRRTIEAIVEHPSFDVVPDGCEPPIHGGHAFELEAVTIQDLLKAEIARAEKEAELESWRDREPQL